MLQELIGKLTEKNTQWEAQTMAEGMSIDEMQTIATETNDKNLNRQLEHFRNDPSNRERKNRVTIMTGGRIYAEWVKSNRQ